MGFEGDVQKEMERDGRRALGSAEHGGVVVGCGYSPARRVSTVRGEEKPKGEKGFFLLFLRPSSRSFGLLLSISTVQRVSLVCSSQAATGKALYCRAHLVPVVDFRLSRFASVPPPLSVARLRANLALWSSAKRGSRLPSLPSGARDDFRQTCLIRRALSPRLPYLASI